MSGMPNYEIPYDRLREVVAENERLKERMRRIEQLARAMEAQAQEFERENTERRREREELKQILALLEGRG